MGKKGQRVRALGREEGKGEGRGQGKSGIGTPSGRSDYACGSHCAKRAGGKDYRLASRSSLSTSRTTCSPERYNATPVDVVRARSRSTLVVEGARAA